MYVWAFGCEPYCSMPSRSTAYRARVALLRVFKNFVESVPKRGLPTSMRYLLGMLCTPSVGATHYIPMGHGMGLRSGTHPGTVQFALARSGPHWEVVHRGMLPDRLGTGTVSFRCVQVPLWHGTVEVQHTLWKYHTELIFNVPSLSKVINFASAS